MTWTVVAPNNLAKTYFYISYLVIDWWPIHSLGSAKLFYCMSPYPKDMTLSKIAYEISNQHDFWLDLLFLSFDFWFPSFDFWFPNWFLILRNSSTNPTQAIILCPSPFRVTRRLSHDHLGGILSKASRSPWFWVPWTLSCIWVLVEFRAWKKPS